MMQGNEQEDSSCKPPQKDSGASPALLHNQVCTRIATAPSIREQECTATMCPANPIANLTRSLPAPVLDKFVNISSTLHL